MENRMTSWQVIVDTVWLLGYDVSEYEDDDCPVLVGRLKDNRW